MREFLLKVDEDGVIRFALPAGTAHLVPGEKIVAVERKPNSVQLTEEEFQEIWLTTPIRADTLFSDLKKKIFQK